MSAPARIDVEQALFDSCTGFLFFVFQREADPQTGTFPPTNRPIAPTGSTSIYNDPIAFAMEILGVVPANPASVTDGDVARLAANWRVFIDLARYRLIVNTLGSFTDVTESDFGRSASYNQLADRMQTMASELLAMYKQYLNPYRQGASSGAIRHTPPTAFPPRWSPGYGGPSRPGYGGYGNLGGY